MHLTKTGKRIMIILFLIPFMYLIVWRILPMLYTLYLSFTDYNMIWDDQPIFVGLKTFKTVLSDRAFLHSVWLSILFGLIAVSVQYVIALIQALVVDSVIRYRNLLIGVLILPMIVAPSVVGIIWYILYNNRIGAVNYLLSFLGISEQTWLTDASTSFVSLIIADTWQWTPFVFLLLISSLQTIPHSLYEASRVDGANWWQITFRIKLPMIKMVSITTILLRFMDAFREFDKVFIMTGGGPSNSTELSTMFVYKAAFQSFNIGQASAMAIILLLLISLLYMICLKFTSI